MRSGLTDRVAVVTGGGRGIGAAIGEALHAAGASVAVVDIDTSGAQGLVRRSAGRVRCYTVDVTDEESVRRAADRVTDEFGSCDILVNNAAVSMPSPTVDTGYGDWERVLRVNLSGAFLWTRQVLPAMRDKGFGRIIGIASMSAKTAPLYGDNVSYAASKAGMIGMTRNVAIEVARWGITVNAIAPGIVDTDLFRQSHSPQRQSDLANKIPIGRLTTPQEIAALAVFLSSDAAASITGETVNVNGGLYVD
ncbi:SDR family NAD(P)-dependent oxidoreductase [Nocardia sp. CDC160]|uniref:SDR family NAD(P)-dependent oxidoreductase n=1 Tax=Nocardia sp. CDC160 TaxID=3112166 RepID=UPI002DBCEC11|nr:SDR family NAD(P)-dependent oxidoreductase [Nocardia sp. CDC160]MEC3920261.1 SDR family NAD(P)-dependent oxidoreductase [Nocardia sp. CDC160]